ncbi:MAG: autotransporter outer membrane beta-barrel domain-containing protein, partial [Puniceicoccales bacterium]|nr:autotransporter outer membrane beta-barrel domain-containing protein [Puniceicoccales bacterium]
GDYSLYWFENGALHGLAIAHHGAPSHLVSVASGMMAMEKQHTVNLVRDTAKLYGEGPFIGSVTSTLKRKELAKNRFGSKEKAHGIVLGANRLVTLGMTDLSCSVFVGITNGKATYDGPFVEKLLKSNRNDFSCGGLARQNFMGFRDMDASINASLLISSGRIRWHRETARGCLYDSKMNDFALQLGADIDHEFYRYGYFELGCFAGMNYDSIGQNGFSEKSPNTAPSSCVSISSMRHNFFAFDLGISVKTAKITNVELNGKLGFHCAALRKHGTATTLIFGTENEAAIHYGSKNCATISAGGSYEFKENWHCAFGLDGKFSSAFRAFSASMSFGHRF